MIDLFHEIGKILLEDGVVVEVPTWQALDVTDKPQGRTYETLNMSFQYMIPNGMKALQHDCDPNLPWAENQFQERVSGEPLNPGNTYWEWPWYTGNVEEHKPQGQFSHTYMERYFPKQAGNDVLEGDDTIYKHGIRYPYGDLDDVVNLLSREPNTRQAYLPVFFPEDTGAVHKERIPCSIGYWFYMREGVLGITYFIRSCDFFRHFRDDVYMTCRLVQWALDQLRDGEGVWKDVAPGKLIMHIGSLHCFEGDLAKLRREYG